MKKELELERLEFQHEFTKHRGDLFINLLKCLNSIATRGSAVGLDTMLQAGKSRVRFPMRLLDFLID
jgi:hypothetical protein